MKPPVVSQSWLKQEMPPVQMDPLEQEIRNLLADEAKRQRCNGLSRKIRAGYDLNPRTLVAIETIKTIMASAGRLAAGGNEELLK
jgi:hypothetical protein